MTRARKIIVTAVVSLVLVGILFYVDIRIHGNQYVSGTVDGDLVTLFGQDMDIFYVKVEQPGKLVVTQDLRGPVFGVALTVNATIRDTVLNQTVDLTKGAFYELEITEEDLKSTGYIDFTFRISAKFGAGAYQLNFIKPGNNPENLFDNIAILTLDVTADNQNTLGLYWKTITKDLGMVKVLVKRENESNILFQDTFIPGKIALPTSLPLGKYQVILMRIGAEKNANWNLLSVHPQTMQCNNESFVRREIAKGQVDEYLIQTTQDDTHIWIIWEKFAKGDKNPMLSAEFIPLSEGASIQSIIIEPNGVVLIPVGSYKGPGVIRITSDCFAKFGIAVENSNGYRKPEISNHKVSQSLNSGKKYLYNLKSTKSASHSITVSLENPSEVEAEVTISMSGTDISEKRIVPAKAKVIVSLNYEAIAEQTVMICIESTLESGPVNFEISYNYTIAEVRFSEKRFCFDPTALTYFSGRNDPAMDWSKITFKTYSQEIYKNNKKVTVLVNAHTEPVINNQGQVVKENGKTKKVEVITDKYYYDLESLPLTITEVIPDENGNIVGEGIEFVVDDWELIPKDGVSQYLDGSSKKVITDKAGLNKIILFQNDYKYRLMVRWVTDAKIIVGRLKSKKADMEVELAVNPIEVIDHSKDKEKWDQYAYDRLLEARIGTMDKASGLKVDIPLQVIQAKIQTESSYDVSAKRYEPFNDSAYFYCELAWGGTVREMKEAVKKGRNIGYIDSGDSIYTYFKENRSKYPPKAADGGYIWLTTPADRYLEILNNSEIDKTIRDSLAETYVHIYLDYGPIVATYWYKKYKYDGYHEIDQMNMFDCTSDFDTSIWTKIKSVTLSDGTLVEVNSTATSDDYGIVFTDPGDAEDKRWDKRWEEPKEPVPDTASAKEKQSIKDRNTQAGINNKKFRTYVEEIVDKIQKSEKIKGEDANKILKEFLQLYLSYQHEKVLKWYEDGKNSIATTVDWYGTINPKQYFPKPFIAQTVISASYGPSQVMYYLAWGYGYKDHPEEPTQWEHSLNKYQTSILLGIKCLGEKMKGVTDINTWAKSWNNALWEYNGSSAYPARVRNNEVKYLPLNKK